MPAWVLKALPYVVVVAIVAACLYFAYDHGVNVTTAYYETKLSELKAQAAADAATESEKHRKIEQGLSDDLYKLSKKNIEDQANANQTIDRLRAAVRAGDVRLSIPVTSCTDSKGAAYADTGTTGGPSTEARAELVPAAADRIIAIAADGDAAVRQLNLVIDAYEAMRTRVNAADSIDRSQ